MAIILVLRPIAWKRALALFRKSITVSTKHRRFLSKELPLKDWPRAWFLKNTASLKNTCPIVYNLKREYLKASSIKLFFRAKPGVFSIEGTDPQGGGETLILAGSSLTRKMRVAAPRTHRVQFLKMVFLLFLFKLHIVAGFVFVIVWQLTRCNSW